MIKTRAKRLLSGFLIATIILTNMQLPVWAGETEQEIGDNVVIDMEGEDSQILSDDCVEGVDSQILSDDCVEGVDSQISTGDCMKGEDSQDPEKGDDIAVEEIFVSGNSEEAKELGMDTYLAATVASGTCGTGVTWKLDDTGLLTISGTGNMDDYNLLNPHYEIIAPPWYDYKDEINSVKIKSGVGYVGGYSFYQLCNLTSVILEEGIYALGIYAFAGCTGLQNVTLPNTLIQIFTGAFSLCENLETINIPSRMINIDVDAFWGCGKLTDVTFPTNLLSIGAMAFGYCTSLTRVHIPAGVKNLSGSSFAYCPGVTSITVDSANPYFHSPDSSNAVIETATNTLILGCKNTVIPDTVTGIGFSAFCGCRNLTNIHIPDSVTSIKSSAFQRCSALTDVNIPSGVTVLGEAVFEDCESLTNIQIPNGITEIKERTFAGSGLTDISIPANITSIGTRAFADCDSLTHIYIPGTVKTIGAYAFSSNNSLADVILEDGITQIGSNAFEFCNSLTHIYIPETVEKIGGEAFAYCYSLEEAIIEDGITQIGYDAFDSCGRLTLYVHKASYTEMYAQNNSIPYKYICSLTFDSNGGPELSDSSKRVYEGKSYGALPTPPDEGVAFLGWYTDPENGTLVTADTICADDAVIYAHWESVSCNLTYDVNGGEPLEQNTKSVIYYKPYGQLTQPVRTGYDFVGWYTQAEGGTHITADTICKGPATIYAHWSAKDYVLTYDVNGGNALAQNTKTVSYNSPYGQLATPTREGYDFVGWYTKAEGGTPITADTICKGAATIYAHWSAKNYVLTYDVNGGNTLSESQKIVVYDNAYGELAIPTREGYDFTGWYTRVQGGVLVTADTICQGNATIYARWEAKRFTLTYDVNGGNPLSESTKEVAYDSAYGVLVTPIRNGYNFLGWYDRIALGELVTKDTICQGDATIYAHWEAKKYTLTYEVSGGDELTETEKEVTYDSAYGELPTPTRNGYVFAGWYTEAEGGEEVTEETICGGDATIYCHWEPRSYTLIYEVNGGDVLTETRKEIWFDIPYGELPVPTRRGMDFVGWYTEAQEGEEVTAETICSGDAIIYAHWEFRYNILTFDLCGGRMEAPQTREIVFEKPYGELPVPTKEGHLFRGWYTAKENGEKVTKDTICEGDATIYAIWIPNSYLLTFDVNGGKELENNKKIVIYGSAYGSLPVPTRKQHIFKGWFTALEDGEEVTEETVCTGHATLYAIWEKNTEGLRVRFVNPEEKYVYTGRAIKPEVYVTNNGIELKEGVDYTVKYANNIKASSNVKAKPQIIVSGKGMYKGKVYAKEAFEIEPRDISQVMVGKTTVTQGTKPKLILTYNGKRLTTKDYFCKDLNSKVMESKTVEIQGTGNFKGYVDVNIEVVAKGTLQKFSVKLDSATVTYNGEEQQISYQVMDAKTKLPLTKDVDYTEKYANNINAGTATLIITGIGKYNGVLYKPFTIAPSEDGKVDDSNVGSYEFTNKAINIDSDICVTDGKGRLLVKGTDYRITYSRNKNVGVARYKVTFLGNYKGTKAFYATFLITPRKLSKDLENLKMIVPDQVYTGKAGKYASVPVISFNDVQVKTTDFSCLYFYLDKDGNRVEISKSNKLRLASDETERTVYVEIYGRGNFEPAAREERPVLSYKVSRKELVSKINLSKTRVTILNENGKRIRSVEYTGEEIEPAVRVEYKVGKTYNLVDPSLYKVEYSNNIYKGKAKIIIKGVDDGTIGSKSVTFSIVAKNVKKVTDIFKDLLSKL